MTFTPPFTVNAIPVYKSQAIPAFDADKGEKPEPPVQIGWQMIVQDAEGFQIDYAVWDKRQTDFWENEDSARHDYETLPPRYSEVWLSHHPLVPEWYKIQKTIGKTTRHRSEMTPEELAAARASSV